MLFSSAVPLKNAKDTRTTGLPTKDDTSETTVRKVYCLVSCKYDSLAKSLSTPLKAIFRAVEGFKVVFTVSSFVGSPVCNKRQKENIREF